VTGITPPALKLAGAAAYAQLNGTKTAVRAAHVNHVMIDSAIDVGASQMGPAFSGTRRYGQSQNEEQRNRRNCKDFPRHFFPPLLKIK